MDAEHFEALSRSLTAPGTRRSTLAAALGGLLGGLLARAPYDGAHDALSKKKKKKKKKKKRLPVVSPPPPPPPLPSCDDGVACTDDARAANGTCTHTPNDSRCRANQVCHHEQGCGCGTGFRNCSGNPAGDGCECQTPGCCRGGACQTTHANGLGQNYYDCVALGTYDQTQAEKARAAFAEIVGPGQTVDGSCGDPGDTSKIRCHDTNDGSVCACWAWSGPLRGYVRAVGGPDCECPTTADAPWN